MTKDAAMKPYIYGFPPHETECSLCGETFVKFEDPLAPAGPSSNYTFTHQTDGEFIYCKNGAKQFVHRVAAAASARPLPPLPKPETRSMTTHGWGAVTVSGYTAEQMRVYALTYGAASAPQAVRMLSFDEIDAVYEADRGINNCFQTQARDLIRKFCEVNGLGIVPLAPLEEGGKA